MKTKTGLLALGVFTIAGALTVSCGGSDSSDDTPTAGSTGTSAGTSSGGNGSAGKTSSAGTTNSGAGTANNNGGTTNNGGTNTNQGGAPDFPGLGGAGPNLPDCPATAMAGEPCTRMNGGNNVCQVDDTTFCVCQGQPNPTWTCPDLGDLGAGGDGGLGGTVTCPAAPKNGDTCTGLGLCPGSQTCGCGFGTVYCQ